MSNLYKLIQKIKENPSLYLDKPSVTCHHLFLNGYLDTRMDLGLEREGSGIEGFQQWIQERVKTTVSQSWSGTILFISGSEKSKFYNFFELFDEFLKWNESLKKEENEKTFNSTGNDFKPSPRALYELLSSIRKRPGMYLATASITRLDMLLRGYSLARREVGIPPIEQEREFEGFQPWIEEKYEIKSGQLWAKI
ncbi:hypothetical protein [Iningainema tapete]|uniref:Uncharacterized protein n=1 Tax=Iningainema tapete BLCC-T55 TaxID=2748662 RepID=A0A8J6XDP9_9CYAN|nr:hypothetical protein [Iningainema tapete]MBD2773484.1 hypothetical protein [Iningainema tapete BLCC-T55]